MCEVLEDMSDVLLGEASGRTLTLTSVSGATCDDAEATTSTDTVDKKTFDIFKICHKGCDVKLTNYFDPIYMGRVEVNLNSSTKKKVLYFQVK